MSVPDGRPSTATRSRAGCKVRGCRGGYRYFRPAVSVSMHRRKHRPPLTRGRGHPQVVDPHATRPHQVRSVLATAEVCDEGKGAVPTPVLIRLLALGVCVLRCPRPPRGRRLVLALGRLRTTMSPAATRMATAAWRSAAKRGRPTGWRRWTTCRTLSTAPKDESLVPFYMPNQLKDALFCGHLVTDLDSIAGAIGAADLYGGLPCRASELNTETLFAIDRSVGWLVG